MEVFNKACVEAYDFLGQTNSIKVLQKENLKLSHLKGFPLVWEMPTEILHPDKGSVQITLHIAFPSEFPFVLPKIYLSHDDNKWIQFIPHVNVDGFICIYDEDSISIDPNQPGRIVKLSLDKALQIVEAGFLKSNINQFKEEFIAYWEEIHGPKDLVGIGLSMINFTDEISQFKLKYFILDSEFSVYKFILIDENKESEIIKMFLESSKIKYTENEALYLGEIHDISPPFSITNEGIDELIYNYFNSLYGSFEKFISKGKEPRLILFNLTIKNEILIFGWQLPPLRLQRKGFRSISSREAFTKFQKSENVARFKFDTFTKKRLNMRTDGFENKETELTIAIAGLGSIGSFLLQNLMVLPLSEIYLIDPEFLTLDNIYRHTLGFSDIGKYKTDALTEYYRNKNPLLKTRTSNESVLNLVQQSHTAINAYDFIFVAIGKTTIETYLCDAITKNIITKPLFIFWVEPFLYGGHCIYINPRQPINYSDLFIDGLYSYNIINEREYKDPTRELLFKEAGCQGSYMPFGRKEINLFFCSIMPNIFNLIEDLGSSSLRFTWKGKLNPLISPPIELSELGRSLQVGALQVVEL